MTTKCNVYTHYLPVYKPDAHNPQIIDYHVWAYIGQILLGEIQGTKSFVKTKRQAQKRAKELRDYFKDSHFSTNQI